MSRSIRYFPGQAYLIAGPALLALTGDAPLAYRLWPLIARGANVRSALEEVLRGGLADIPDLVLVEFDGSRTRVLARGPHAAAVQVGGGAPAVCSGQGVSTWNEQVFDGAPAGTVNGPGGPWLPIVAGMAMAGGFDWDQESNDKVGPEVVEWVGVLRPDGSGSAGAAPVAAQRPEPAPVTESEPTVQPESASEPEAMAEESRPTPPSPDPDPVPAEASPTPEPSLEVPTDPPAATLAETRTEPADGGYEHLFGSTIYRSVEDAAVREVVEEPAPPIGSVPDVLPPLPDPAPRLGDHDGSTIMASALAALRPSSPPPAEPAAGPSAVLVLSTGEEVELDRGVVIGRRPQVDRVAGTEIPRLVTVESPQQDISRSHLRIGRRGDGFTAIDLHSMNGTVLIGANGVTRTLGGGELCDFLIGDVLDIGEGVTLSLRAIT